MFEDGIESKQTESPQLLTSLPDTAAGFSQSLNFDELEPLEPNTRAEEGAKLYETKKNPVAFSRNSSANYSYTPVKVDWPQNFERTYSLTSINRYGTFSSDNFSEFDVILENGKKVKHAISLPKRLEEHIDSKPKSLYERYLTPQNKKVLKCVLSYFLGSLFTFIPVLRANIGIASHMAAISGFFFNPGLSLGLFIESMAFGIAFILFGSAMSLLSMVNMLFWNRIDYPYIGRISTLLVFIGLGSFIIAYIKASYPKPNIIKCIPNSYFIMYIAFISHTPFVKNESNFYEVYELGKGIFCGILINCIICTQIWPNWEADNLRQDMITSLNSLQHTLSVIVKTFLLEEVLDSKDGDIDKLLENHRKSFLTLKQHYDNAKFEFQLEPEKYKHIGEVVDRLNRLSQKLGGLSSGIDAQKELLRSSKTSINESITKANRRRSKLHKVRNKRMSMAVSSSNPNAFKTIRESQISGSSFSSDIDTDQEPDIEVLFNFLNYVGPPTKSLTFTCKRAILELIKIIESLGGSTNTSVFSIFGGTELLNASNVDYISLAQLRDNIQSALDLFSKSQSKAMSTLYKSTQYDGKPDEEIFLVYFFVFSLEEFATELQQTISAIDNMANTPAFTGSRWLSNTKMEIFAFIATFFTLPETIRNFRFQVEELTDSKIGLEEEPLHNPAPQTLYQKIRASTWYFLMSLRDHRLIYAIKASMAVVLVASPAYILDYKDTFNHWRIGWTLLTINIVMSPTVGFTNLCGVYLLSGTWVGSIIAYLVFSIFSHDFITLIVISTLVAIPSFYIYLATEYFRFGQFLLLSYNLIVLTTYANRNQVNFSFSEYAFIRAFSVSLGVCVGLFFSVVIVPYEARRELRRELSVFFLDMIKLYTKLLKAYTVPVSLSTANRSTVTKARSSVHYSKLVMSDIPSRAKSGSEDMYEAEVQEFLDLELQLQLQLLNLDSLLANTVHEPRLKGPFPHETYRKILHSCQIVLDKFMSMRVIITKEEWRTRVMHDFVLPLSKYRTELVGAIVLYFYMLASVLHLKSPLPPYLPPAAQARRRLIKALRELPVVRSRVIYHDDDHHIVYYAFVVLLDEIISELDVLGIHFKSLYGSMEDVEFNNMFIEYTNDHKV